MGKHRNDARLARLEMRRRRRSSEVGHLTRLDSFAQNFVASSSSKPLWLPDTPLAGAFAQTFLSSTPTSSQLTLSIAHRC